MTFEEYKAEVKKIMETEGYHYIDDMYDLALRMDLEWSDSPEQTALTLIDYADFCSERIDKR